MFIENVLIFKFIFVLVLYGLENLFSVFLFPITLLELNISKGEATPFTALLIKVLLVDVLETFCETIKTLNELLKVFFGIGTIKPLLPENKIDGKLLNPFSSYISGFSSTSLGLITYS